MLRVEMIDPKPQPRDVVVRMTETEAILLRHLAGCWRADEKPYICCYKESVAKFANDLVDELNRVGVPSELPEDK